MSHYTVASRSEWIALPHIRCTEARRSLIGGLCRIAGVALAPHLTFAGRIGVCAAIHHFLEREDEQDITRPISRLEKTPMGIAALLQKLAPHILRRPENLDV